MNIFHRIDRLKEQIEFEFFEEILETFTGLGVNIIPKIEKILHSGFNLSLLTDIQYELLKEIIGKVLF